MYNQYMWWISIQCDKLGALYTDYICVYMSFMQV